MAAQIPQRLVISLVRTVQTPNPPDRPKKPTTTSHLQSSLQNSSKKLALCNQSATASKKGYKQSQLPPFKKRWCIIIAVIDQSTDPRVQLVQPCTYTKHAGESSAPRISCGSRNRPQSVETYMAEHEITTLASVHGCSHLNDTCDAGAHCGGDGPSETYKER